MFLEARTFNQPIEDWDVSRVTRMSSMFNLASTFDQPIEDWDVSSVVNMNYMFYKATTFNQCLGSWGSKTSDTVITFNMLVDSACPDKGSEKTLEVYGGNTYTETLPDPVIGPWCQG